jgi:hypothetical protein
MAYLKALRQQMRLVRLLWFDPKLCARCDCTALKVALLVVTSEEAQNMKVVDYVHL